MTESPEPTSTTAVTWDPTVDIEKVGHRKGCPTSTAEPAHHACWHEGMLVVRVKAPTVADLQAELAAARAQIADWEQRYLEVLDDELGLRDQIQAVAVAAQDALVILEGLRLGVLWELAPTVMALISELSPRLMAALAALSSAEDAHA